MSLDGIGQSLGNFCNTIKEHALAAGSCIVAGATATGAFLGKTWTLYAAPAVGGAIALASTGTGAGVIVAVAAVAFFGLSEHKYWTEKEYQRDADGKKEKDPTTGESILRENRRWMIKLGLQIAAGVALVAAGFLFAMGSAAVGFVGIGLIIPALL